MTPVPCFSDTPCIALDYDNVNGLTASPIVDPEGGLVCGANGLGVEVPHARAFRQAAGAVNGVSSSSVFDPVVLDQTSWDNDNIFTATSDHFRIVTPGLYLVEGAVSFEVAPTAGIRVGGFFVHNLNNFVSATKFHRVGYSTLTDSSDNMTIAMSALWRFNAGDYLWLASRQNSGGAMPLFEGSAFLYMAVSWLSK